MAILMIGRAASGFTQPPLRLAIFFQQIIRHSRYQRRKMRMEGIKPHLRFGNLDCSGGLAHRVQYLGNAVIGKIWI
jgi:hypothetical protein